MGQYMGRLIEQHLPKMRTVVRGVAFKTHLDYNDLMQESVEAALLRGHSYRDDGRGEASFLAWFYRVCRNRAIDIIRRDRKMIKVELINGMGPIGYTRADDREYLLKVYRLLRRPNKHRRMWSLAMYMIAQGYKMDEIAAYFGLSNGGIRSVIHRIREYLEEHTGRVGTKRTGKWNKQ